MAPLLEARNLSKTYGTSLRGTVNVALRPFSLAITEDQPAITAVVGESGSGKTTLARLLMGFERATSGSVLYRGKEMRRLSGRGRRHFYRDVQMILQDPFDAFNPFYKIDDVLRTPIRKFGLARSRAARDDLIGNALRGVGLRPEDLLGRYPHQLSGGQLQRIMVARCVLVRPKLIIADEPVSMVDSSLRATILGSLRRLHEELGTSIIYITHDLTTAYQISHNVVVLYRGAVAEAGDADSVILQPQHPYTQLLVDSVPLANPDHPWGKVAPVVEVGGAQPRYDACPFAPRCPHAMPICVEAAPPLYRTAPTDAASCYLHREQPTLPSEEMDGAFSPVPTRGAQSSPSVIPGAERSEAS